MLEAFSKINGVNHGMCIASTSGTISDSFLILHFVSKKTTVEKKPVVIVSSKYSEMNYRMMAAKLALRWDSTLVTFIQIESILEDDLSPNSTKVLPNLIEIIRSKNSSLIAFDDVSVFERLGIKSVDVSLFCLSLMDCEDENGLLYFSFPVQTEVFHHLLSQADFTVDLQSIGGGFGKDVTGKLQIKVRNEELNVSETELLYLTGERSVKCFYPGGIFAQ